MKPFVRNEEEHLRQTEKIVADNLRLYEKEVKTVRQERDELNDKITPRDRELNSQMSQNLAIASSMLSHIYEQLDKNRKALDKPYFGRIDYEETAEGSQQSIYIGKHGISKAAVDKDEAAETVVVDWRAPVAKLYYESQLGKARYEVPEQEAVDVDLVLKRTFDIEKGILNGYYDSDVAANDELLVKYLAQHKDVVLGDIIATIQKEQDEIIRQNPYHNTIVQGVAGSGKTTVALHKISHILYNYPKRFKPEDFCIIASSDMLLSYIVSGLPELEVDHVYERRMDLFIREEMEEDWKKSYETVPVKAEEAFRCRMDFVKALDKWCSRIWFKLLKPKTIEDDKLGVILSRQAMYDLLNYRRGWSTARLEKLLNETLVRRIRMLCSRTKEDPEFALYRRIQKEEMKVYAHYFDLSRGYSDVRQVYIRFLADYADQNPDLVSPSLLAQVTARVEAGRLDVYDMASMALIRRYFTQIEEPQPFGQIIIDEAQDFGEMIYYVLKKLETGCYFTIMGDVSQNIHYETGMNDWEPVVKEVFNNRNDRFQILSKSYRNTIEISEFAGKVLTKASKSRYRIDPVIRHGDPVDASIVPARDQIRLIAEHVRGAASKGDRSCAVVCRTSEEAAFVEDQLKKLDPELFALEDCKLMVLPIELVKGLEFDLVMIYQATPDNYPDDPKSAKLLYVAITRALHQLHLWADTGLTRLIE